jgi:hypothetical protein
MVVEPGRARSSIHGPKDGERWRREPMKRPRAKDEEICGPP